MRGLLDEIKQSPQDDFEIKRAIQEFEYGIQEQVEERVHV